MAIHEPTAHRDDRRVHPGNMGGRDRAVWGVALASLWVLFAPAWAMAGACDGFAGDCQLQVQAPITYSGWQTQGGAYYCTGDHFYYVGQKQGHPGNWTSDNSCFSIIESVDAEDDVDKFDALIANWCLNSQALTITIGCITGSDPFLDRELEGCDR